jgi:hypothetical protein
MSIDDGREHSWDREPAAGWEAYRAARLRYFGGLGLSTALVRRTAPKPATVLRLEGHLRLVTTAGGEEAVVVDSLSTGGRGLAALIRSRLVPAHAARGEEGLGPVEIVVRRLPMR